MNKNEIFISIALPVYNGEDYLAEAIDSTEKLNYLTQLSGLWFELDHIGISGAYAQQIAEQINFLKLSNWKRMLPN